MTPLFNPEGTPTLATGCSHGNVPARAEGLEHFAAERLRLAPDKMRQNKNLERSSDSIRMQSALTAQGAGVMPADATVFLPSKASPLVNGHMLYVDGGVTTSL